MSTPKLIATSLLTACLLAACGGESYDSLMSSARSSMGKGDSKAAIIQLKNALQIDPGMLPVQVLLGKALLKNGEAASAELALLESLRLGVNRAEVVVPLAQALMAQGKLKLLLEQQSLLPAGLPPGAQMEIQLLRAAAHADQVAGIPGQPRGKPRSGLARAISRSGLVGPRAGRLGWA